jgi:type IV pilus assembly protein PilN
MASINLLNWREEKRNQLVQEFYTMLVGVVILGVVVVVAGQLQLNSMIDYQESRNRYLESEIKEVDKAIAQIRELEKKKSDLLARMEVIQQLQSNRSDSVHMLDELVKSVPEGVHLTRFAQKKNILTFDGIAQSNARVSAYMRNIEHAEWLKDPSLKVISTKKKGIDNIGYSQFTLSSKQSSPALKNKDKKG